MIYTEESFPINYKQIKMRKRKFLLSFFATIALTVVGVFSAKHFQSAGDGDYSSLLMQNVEALSSSNESSGPTPCGGPKIGGVCQSQNTINCKDLYGCQ